MQMMTDPHGRTARPRLIWYSPKSVRNYLFYLLASRVDRDAPNTLLSFIGHVIRVVVLGITPPTARLLNAQIRQSRVIAVFVATAAATFIFSYVFTVIASSNEGTFWPDEASRLSFSQDWHNVVIYTLIAPLYCAFSAVIIYLTIRSTTISLEDAASPFWGVSLASIVKLAFVATVIIAIAAIVQVHYYRDNILELQSNLRNLKPQCVDKLYWFLDEGRDGQRYLNGAGVYYFIAQFIRAVLVSGATICFLVNAVEAFKVGVKIDGSFIAEPGAIAEVRQKMESYILTEIAVKGLVTTLYLHGWLWGDSCLRGVENIKIASIALACVAFVLLSLPRQFVEFRLLRGISRQHLPLGQSIDWPELANQQERVVLTAISVIFAMVVFYLLAWTAFQVGPDGFRWIVELTQRLRVLQP